MSDPAKTSASLLAEKPTVFISHKESEAPIASELNKFLTNKGGGEGAIHVEQFTYTAAGLPIGDNINQALLTKLADAEVLLLLFTRVDEDWSYCMWEAGAAIDARRPHGTRVVVMTLTDERPKVFSNDLMVDPRKLEDLQNLVNQFMTKPDFFPDRAEPLTGHTAKGSYVLDAADKLFEVLAPLLPPLETMRTRSWPAYPWMRMEMTFAEIEELKELPRDKACEKVASIARIIESDRNLAVILQKPSLDGIETLAALYKEWSRKLQRRESEEAPIGWVRSLGRQLYDAACDDYPRPEWELLEDVRRRGQFLPLVLRVKVLPAEQRRHFDVYFPRFEVEGSAVIRMPNAPDE